MEKKKKGCWTLFYIYLCCGFLFIFLGPDPKTSGGRLSSRFSACYSNIRIIQGAVEMYNMDSNTQMSELKVDDLIDGHYIKEKPILPEISCSYLGRDLEKDGNVYCKFHGDIKGIKGKDKYTKLSEDIAKNTDAGSSLNGCLNRIPVSLLWPLFVIRFKF